MNILTKDLIQSILEEFQIETPKNDKVVALFGGGFKPPTRGHFEVVKQVLDNYPDITEFQIIIGSGVRDEITQEMSLEIWEIYKPLLSNKVKLITTSSPLTYIKDYIKNHSDEKIYAVIGIREGVEGDLKDANQREKLYKKHSNNLTVIPIKTGGGVSGTIARKSLLNNDIEGFTSYLPSGLTSDSINQIWGILGKEQLNEINDQKPLLSVIKSLTKYMVNQGLNIKPLPTLKIIDSDVKNADDILGRTAYYSPDDCSITLYTLNRHPKDISRSFSHEMIHRMQDNEGRLDNIDTTNTNEDGDLSDLEKEAYLKGNMIFRNWEDSIKNV
jgi:hypothetical protein